MDFEVRPAPRFAVKCSLEEGAFTPEYMTSGAAGADLRSFERTVVPAGERKLARTGIKMRIPDGYEGQIRSRSGLALKKGICVLNSPGTIDSDYVGEIGVLLYNSSKEDFIVEIGDRIAQIIFSAVEKAEFPLGDVGTTDRGEGGFESTGRK